MLKMNFDTDVNNINFINFMLENKSDGDNGKQDRNLEIQRATPDQENKK